jgi:hypothetical protein
MVHVYCLTEDCRRAIHLQNKKYWNFKGKVKCRKCGQKMKIELKNGEFVSNSKMKEV